MWDLIDWIPNMRRHRDEAANVETDYSGRVSADNTTCNTKRFHEIMGEIWDEFYAGKRPF